MSLLKICEMTKSNFKAIMERDSDHDKSCMLFYFAHSNDRTFSFTIQVPEVFFKSFEEKLNPKDYIQNKQILNQSKAQAPL